MRGRLAWLLGLAGLLAFLRRWRAGRPEPVEAAPSPHAAELRRKLDGTREPADESGAPDLPADLDDRRRQVHGSGRAAIDEMRGE